MPVGEAIAEVAAQAAMEAGGEEIKRRYGCKGCVIALLILLALIGAAVWYLEK